MSGQMMLEMGHGSNGGNGHATVSAVEEQSIHLQFKWSKSCMKGKYPSWIQPRVTQLLHDRGLTDEKLEHELNLMNHKIDEYYGMCMKCFVILYFILLLLGFASIGGQFALPEYRDNVLGLFNGDYKFKFGIDFLFDFIFIIGGIILWIIFLFLMLIHRTCWSTIKYKKSMKELKDYLYQYDVQNKYNLVKWVHKHTIDNIQFDIYITPLQRENNYLQKPEMAFSTVSI